MSSTPKKPKNKPGQARTLTRQKIVANAIALSDQAGYETLSMRKLAAKLGVTAMSLYNHVANKDALLDLMLDRIVAEFETPSPQGNWQEMMRRRAHSMRNAFLRHSWAPPLMISKIALGDEILRDLNATVGCLVSAGFSYAQADWAKNAIDSHIYGYTLQELNYPVAPDEYKSAAARFLPKISKADYPFVHGAAKEIIDGNYDGITRFDFGLDLILDGLQKQLDAAATDPRP